MIDVVRYLVIAAAGVLALGIIVATVTPQWRRILRTAAGRPDSTVPAEHWRGVHLAADRRPPVTKEQR